MKWARTLEIAPGITAVIGGGGKTTLLRALGEELAVDGKVLLCSTTKIFPFDGMTCVTAEEAEGYRAAAERSNLICGGSLLENGKLTAPEVPLAQLAALFTYILVEADGSAQRPMKAHAFHEPVIPAEANQTVCVVGASGFGRLIRDAAHRPERYAELSGGLETDAITPELAAAVLQREHLHQRVLVNQAELAPAQARRLTELLDCPAVAGSLQLGKIFWPPIGGGNGDTEC